MSQHAREYGLSTQLYLVNKPGSDGFVLGGVATDSSRWTRVLSTRAAHLLWSHLGRLLLPDQERISARLNTTPLRSNALPLITNHCQVAKSETGYYEITGWAGDAIWAACLDLREARRLLMTLDEMLFP